MVVVPQLLNLNEGDEGTEYDWLCERRQLACSEQITDELAEII